MVKSVLLFIIDPFYVDNGDVKVPKLFKKATQSWLVWEGADQQGLPVFLWQDGQVIQPIREAMIECFFHPYVIVLDWSCRFWLHDHPLPGSWMAGFLYVG